MYLNAAVVANEAELAKAIHEEADAGTSSADHIRQCFLRNRRDKGFRFTRLAEFRHQQKNAGQSFLTGIEKLIDKVGLGPHTARQQELEEYVCECRLVVHHASHFISADLEGRATG